jgi:hypothetical protein
VSRSLKLLVVALAVSVVLNIFGFGFFVARMARRSHDGRGNSSLREKWKEQAGPLRGRREAVERARRAVREALVAEPFDSQALTAALASLRAETNETQEALDQALVRFALGLGPEERRKLAESRWFGTLGGLGGGRGR